MDHPAAVGVGAGRTSAEDAVAALREQRAALLAELGRLPDEACRYEAQWANITRTLNFLLRTYALHEIDHLQHAQRLLQGRGMRLREAQVILMKAQALRGEMEALLLSLSDEEFDAAGPGSNDWSMRQVVEHLQTTDRAYLENARRALAEAVVPAEGHGGAPHR